MAKKKSTTAKARAALMSKRKKETFDPATDLLSSGSTLLNLAMSGSRLGLYCKGRYCAVVGDSQSGKTWLVLTALAEATFNSQFDDYRLIYDDAEDGALMKLEEFFGEEIVDRIEPPAWDEANEEMHSEKIEDFYDFATNAADEAMRENGKPCIYILDSMDALSSEQEIEKEEANKKARATGKETTGSYGDGKAKKNSANLRRLRAKFKKSGSILIIISQTRDDISPTTFSTKSRSGGRALKFYAHTEFWTSIVKTDKVEKDDGKKAKNAIHTRCRITKNRLTGNEQDIDLTILKGYGVDDIGDNIDYLCKVKYWPKTKATIDATDFEMKATKAKLVRHIEQEGLEDDLAQIVEEVWNEEAEKRKPKRQPRYARRRSDETED